MELLNLWLFNFRNFSSKKIIFDKDLTVIIGPNGSGKSNILEAIALLCAVRSTRVETDLDLIKFTKDEAKVEAKVRETEKDIRRLTVNFQVLPSSFTNKLYVRKAYFIDSFKKRLFDFIPFLSIVVFTPFDLELVTGSPSIRRHHLDSLLSSVDREYWRSISSYNKVIVRRNKVLQRIADGQSKPQELDFWDVRLCEHAKYISRKREEFFEFLNKSRDQKQGSTLRQLQGTTLFLDISWELKQSLLSSEKLLKNRERDIAAGATLSGPHRDDFRFMFEKRDLEFFGSRGEQRMAVLTLKLAELEYYKTRVGTRPILALDDIFSELDWEHREAILSVVGSQQTIITAAEAESIPKKIFKKAKIVELK